MHDAVDEGDARLVLADLRSRLARVADALAAAKESHERGTPSQRSFAAGISLALEELASLHGQESPFGDTEG